MQLTGDKAQNKSFAIHTLGCKVNTYESDVMAERLKTSGFVELSFEDVADIYIINTCTVTNIADRKSRQMLRRARKLNPDALIVAAGCYVDDAIKNDKLEELIEDRVIDLAVSNKDKNAIVRLVTVHLSGGEAKAASATATAAASVTASAAASVTASATASETASATASETATAAEYKPEQAAEPDTHAYVEADADSSKTQYLTQLDGHTRAFIKVQDGCNMFCSYCIIPYVRGELRNRTAEDVHEEAERLAANGVAEIVINGIHLSSMRNKLIDIIAAVESVEGIKRIRLGSLEPMLITEEFVTKLKNFRKLCPHFHLSLQSGNDEILKAMNRHYTTEQYARSCDILKANYEHPAITTDIIVGFPGETNEQFEDDLSFAKRIGLYEAHVFKFSRRKGTPADTMPGQLTDAVKSDRSERLIALTDELSDEFRQYYIGRKVEFLSEELIELDGVTYETGYSAEYVRCIKPSSNLHVNEIICGTASRIIHENVIDGALLLL